MLFYWILFLIPATLAISQKSKNSLIGRTSQNQVGWFIVLFVLTSVIGLRHEVGEDWKSYMRHVDTAALMTFGEITKVPDPAYFILNWIGSNFGGGVYTVNIICGLLFSIGLISFARSLPRPALAMAVAAPYLILVVAMGYSRQGVAIGISMLGLSYLERSRISKFVLSICLASLFHKSAIVLLFFSIIIRTKNRILTAFAIIGLAAGLFALLALETIELLQFNYLDYQLESDGAGVRVAMNALPAAIFLWYRKKFYLTVNQRLLWTTTSVLAITFIWLLQISPSSTAVDRLALYLIPLQLFVWSHFPDVIGKLGKQNLIPVLMVLFLYALVLFVWLNFANHSQAWIPYKFYIIEFL